METARSKDGLPTLGAASRLNLNRENKAALTLRLVYPSVSPNLLCVSVVLIT